MLRETKLFDKCHIENNVVLGPIGTSNNDLIWDDNYNIAYFTFYAYDFPLSIEITVSGGYAWELINSSYKIIINVLSPVIQNDSLLIKGNVAIKLLYGISLTAFPIKFSIDRCIFNVKSNVFELAFTNNFRRNAFNFKIKTFPYTDCKLSRRERDESLFGRMSNINSDGTQSNIEMEYIGLPNTQRQKNLESISNTSPHFHIKLEVESMLRNVLRLTEEVINRTGMILGTIIPYYREDQPENFLICDGRSCSGYELEDIMENTPDLRGKFIRMIGGNSAEFGVTQEDAIRNITGSFNIDDYSSETAPGNNPPGATLTNSASGIFSVYRDAYHNGNWCLDKGSSALGSTYITIDASRVVPTAAENRPINVAMNYIIYAGKKKSRVILKKIISIFGGDLV